MIEGLRSNSGHLKIMQTTVFLLQVSPSPSSSCRSSRASGGGQGVLDVELLGGGGESAVRGE